MRSKQKRAEGDLKTHVWSKKSHTVESTRCRCDEKHGNNAIKTVDFSAKLHHFSAKVPLFSAALRRGGKERHSKRRVRGRNGTPTPGAFRVVSAGSREQFKIGELQCAIGKIVSRFLLHRRLRRMSFGQGTFSFSAMGKNARGNPRPFRT